MKSQFLLYTMYKGHKNMYNSQIIYKILYIAFFAKCAIIILKLVIFI